MGDEGGRYRKEEWEKGKQGKRAGGKVTEREERLRGSGHSEVIPCVLRFSYSLQI